jgi:hypothetical protein
MSHRESLRNGVVRRRIRGHFECLQNVAAPLPPNSERRSPAPIRRTFGAGPTLSPRRKSTKLFHENNVANWSPPLGLRTATDSVTVCRLKHHNLHIVSLHQTSARQHRNLRRDGIDSIPRTFARPHDRSSSIIKAPEDLSRFVTQHYSTSRSVFPFAVTFTDGNRPPPLQPLSHSSPPRPPSGELIIGMK